MFRAGAALRDGLGRAAHEHGQHGHAGQQLAREAGAEGEELRATVEEARSVAERVLQLLRAHRERHGGVALDGRRDGVGVEAVVAGGFAEHEERGLSPERGVEDVRAQTPERFLQRAREAGHAHAAGQGADGEDARRAPQLHAEARAPIL